MLTVRFDPSIPRSRLNRIASGLRAAEPAILDECGQKLVGLARIYFDNLSRGGTGYSGRTWRSPKPSTVARRKRLARQGRLVGSADVQGIVTGELSRSLEYTVTGSRISLGYRDPKAAFFNVWRRLIPTVLPRPWRAACDAIVQSKIDAIQ